MSWESGIWKQEDREEVREAYEYFDIERGNEE